MSIAVPLLTEGLAAELAVEGAPLTMHTQMVFQIAHLLEGLGACRALEDLVSSVGQGVFRFDDLVAVPGLVFGLLALHCVAALVPVILPRCALCAGFC